MTYTTIEDSWNIVIKKNPILLGIEHVAFSANGFISVSQQRCLVKELFRNFCLGQVVTDITKAIVGE